MADYITKIRTNQGDKQIDYNALANKPIVSVPISDEDIDKWDELLEYTDDRVTYIFHVPAGDCGKCFVTNWDNTDGNARLITQYIFFHDTVTIHKFEIDGITGEMLGRTKEKLAKESQIGVISAALDELHNYAQALISGGES